MSGPEPRHEPDEDCDAEDQRDQLVENQESQELYSELDEDHSDQGTAEDEADSDEIIEKLLDKNGRRKRGQHRNIRLSLDHTIKTIFHSLETSTRISFLCTFNDSMAKDIVQYHLGSIEGVDNMVLMSEGLTKVKNNINSWRCNAFKNLYIHVRRLDSQFPIFKRQTALNVIQQHLESFYKLDEFIEIFDFTKKKINLPQSSKKVAKWCKIVYIEMAALVKMRVNRGATCHADDAGKEYTAKFLSDRFQNLSNSKRLQKFVPDSHVDVALLPDALRAVREKKVLEVHDPDEDPNLFVPEDSDEEGAVA